MRARAFPERLDEAQGIGTRTQQHAESMRERRYGSARLRRTSCAARHVGPGSLRVTLNHRPLGGPLPTVEAIKSPASNGAPDQEPNLSLDVTVTRISSFALIVACIGILVGFAAIGAASVVLAKDAKLQLAFDLPRIQMQALAEQPAAAKAQVIYVIASGGEQPRRAVRVVYVGPITAR